jgi:hypothetical protein
MIIIDGGGYLWTSSVLEPNQYIAFRANTPLGGVTPSNIHLMTTAYDRPWDVWYDENGRLRAAVGYHTLDYATGQNHSAYEIKTSDDPNGPTPYNLITRLYLQSNKRFGDAGFNYLNSLVLNHGAYETNVGWGPQLVMPTANGLQTIYVAGMLAKVDPSDNTIIEMQASPFGSNKSVKYRFFRDTNTTGQRTIEFMKGDGTNTVVMSFDMASGVVSTIGDVEVKDSSRGVVLKSPNGTRYRLTVDNSGNVLTTIAS